MDLSKMTIAAIKDLLASLTPAEVECLLPLIEKDGRTGLRSLAESYRREEERRLGREQLLFELTKFERALDARGFDLVAGVDEAGRGALAGPLVAAAVILPKNTSLYGLRDSKRLTAEQRDALYDLILDTALASHVVKVDADLIDTNGIQWANIYALEQSVLGLRPAPDYVLSDAFSLPSLAVPHLAVTKGDDLSLSIAAASVLAKVTRDRIMAEYHDEYPQYGFNKHKGYGTDDHNKALCECGPSPLHRRYFGPVARLQQLSFLP